MDSAPSLETVFQALYALYRNPDISGKEKASVWLGELQRSVYAWQVSDQLLQLNKDVESCYFAAQTMRTKIQYAFNELPQSSHQSLRDSLLNHVGKINEETPPVIATQLCLALADLALQMVAWLNPTKDLVERFGNEKKHMHFLVEVLTVLPEEVNSKSLRLGENRRTEVTSELTTNAQLMIKVLELCLDSCGDDVRLQGKVFRCLGSWFSISIIPQATIINSKVLMEPFKVLLNVECPSQLHEAASDCICSALYAAEIRQHSDLEERGQLAMNLMQGVLALPEAYHLSVAMEDIDKSINLCRIFTEMGESFLDIIVASPNQGFGDLRTLELLLTCIGHYQYEVADITFNFWYRMSDMLYKHNNQALNEIFKPYIQRLIIALCRHCQFDPDHEGIPSSKDEFSDFRKRVSELIKDVVFIVGSATCFSQMFENLKNQSSDASWDSSEAALFVMTAVAKNILPDENEIVPQVLQAILHLPDTTHIALKYTSTQLVGELCEWIENHPDYLDPVLQFLLSGLQNPQLANAAATSLQSVCARCQNEMVNHFMGLLQIAQAMDSFKVSNEAAIGLLKGTAIVLSKMPHDKISDGLRQLCAMQVTPLNKLLEQADCPKPDSSKGTDPTVWLDRLAAIFSNVNPTVHNGQAHPCQPAIQEIWPVLSNTCTKYQADVKVIERCCRCIRFAVRCLGKESASLLTPLVTQMVSLYSVHQHSCFLYLGSILVDEYGKEEGCIQGLIDMLIAFCGPTFKILEETNGLRNHPDTVDDLFRLCLRFVQQAPLAFLQCSVIKAILACSIAAAAISHRDANSSLTKFLCELIKSALPTNPEDADDHKRCELIKAHLAEHGQAMIQALINACLFSLPTYMIADSADVIFQLLQLDKEAVRGFLEQTLKSLPTHNAGGAVTATAEQLSDFLDKICREDDKKKFAKIIREFSRLYR